MSVYKKGMSTKLSDDFTSAEFDCHGNGCCNSTEVDPKLVELLQKIHDHFNKDVVINSAYRCAKHNKKVGGASKSKHLYGQAADIKVSGVSPLKVAQYCESIGVKGIGQYSNFVHVDTRTNKYFWYGNGQSPRNTFGKYTDAVNRAPQQSESNASVSNRDTVSVTGKTVFIRVGPGTQFDAIDRVAVRGEVFKKVKHNGWVPVHNSAISSDVLWISQRYVSADNKCTGNTVNMRRGPGTQFESAGIIRKNNDLNVLDPLGWTPILVEGVCRWISTKYIQAGEDEQ